eukprot:scaffold10560_cov133-Isochrysis_galbana.AAC.7
MELMMRGAAQCYCIRKPCGTTPRVALAPRAPPPSYSSPKSASAWASSCRAEMAPDVSELVIIVTPSAAKPPYKGSFTRRTRKSQPEQPRWWRQAR